MHSVFYWYSRGQDGLLPHAFHFPFVPFGFWNMFCLLIRRSRTVLGMFAFYSHEWPRTSINIRLIKTKSQNKKGQGKTKRLLKKFLCSSPSRRWPANNNNNGENIRLWIFMTPWWISGHETPFFSRSPLLSWPSFLPITTTRLLQVFGLLTTATTTLAFFFLPLPHGSNWTDGQVASSCIHTFVRVAVVQGRKEKQTIFSPFSVASIASTTHVNG